MTNHAAASGCGQLVSTGVNFTRVKVLPPSSERRATQPPPANSEVALIAWTSDRSVNVPDERPVQVVPPSAVDRIVPNAPTA